MRWNKVSINDVFTTIRNGANIKQTEGSGGVPITRIETIADGRIDLNRLGYAGVSSGAFKDYYLQAGDILMSHINSWTHLGKCAMVDGSTSPVIHGMNLLLLRVNQDRLLPKYAKYFFETSAFKSQVHRIANQSVNQSSFAVTKLKQLQIPLPPLPVQKQIADTLDKADALRQKDQQLLRKYDELAQSIFYEMFGDPVRNERGWDVRPLNTMVAIKPVSVLPEEILESRYVGLEHIEKDTGEVVGIDAADLKSNKFRFDASNILYGKLRPYLRKVALPDFSGVCSTDIFPINCHNSDRVFVAQILRSDHFTNYAATISVGANLPRIGKDQILNYETICPPVEQQKIFARSIEMIRIQKDHIRGTVRYTDSLFQKLLNESFNK